MESLGALVPALAWIVAAASLLLTSVLGIVLTFHWFRYAMNPGATMLACTTYVVVSFMLLSGMFATLLLFTVSV